MVFVSSDAAARCSPPGLVVLKLLTGRVKTEEAREEDGGGGGGGVRHEAERSDLLRLTGAGGKTFKVKY